jgi:hypothetical protein
MQAQQPSREPIYAKVLDRACEATLRCLAVDAVHRSTDLARSRPIVVTFIGMAVQRQLPGPEAGGGANTLGGIGLEPLEF